MARYFDRIAARFKRQEQKGMSKYGQILEDNPRGLKEALEYAAEEVTDLLMYLEEAIEKIGTATGSCRIEREPKEGMRDSGAKIMAVVEAAKEFIDKNNDCENKECPVSDCWFCDYNTDSAALKLQQALADLEGGR